MSVFYEWDVETVSVVDDLVIDHDHRGNFKACKIEAAHCDPGYKKVIVLVRDDDYSRSWAYIEDGKLPTHFRDAYGRVVARVPKRFMREVNRT
jgi:hypothetical protein